MINKLINYIKDLLGLSSAYYDNHYQSMGLQPIEWMQAKLTKEEFIGYLKGSIIKYSFRAGRKSGESYEKDMTKCKRYEEWLSQAEQGLTIDPRK